MSFRGRGRSVRGGRRGGRMGGGTVIGVKRKGVIQKDEKPIAHITFDVEENENEGIPPMIEDEDEEEEEISSKNEGVSTSSKGLKSESVEESETSSKNLKSEITPSKSGNVTPSKKEEMSESMSESKSQKQIRKEQKKNRKNGKKKKRERVEETRPSFKYGECGSTTTGEG